MESDGCEQGPWVPRWAQLYCKDGKVWGRTKVNSGKKKKKGRPRWPEAKLDAGCLGDRLCPYNRDGIDAMQRHAHPSTCQAQFSSLEAWPIAFRIYLAHCP